MFDALLNIYAYQTFGPRDEILTSLRGILTVKAQTVYEGSSSLCSITVQTVQVIMLAKVLI